MAADLGSTFRARLFSERERFDFSSCPNNQVRRQEITQLDLLIVTFVWHIVDFLAVTRSRLGFCPLFPTGMLLANLVVGPHTENLHRPVVRLDKKIGKYGVKRDLRDTMG